MPEPTSDLRARLTEALTRKHYRRAAERIEASPEEHCAAFADAALPVVEAALTEQRERGENAEDRLRKAEQAYGWLAARHADAEAARDRWRTRAEQAEAGASALRERLAHVRLQRDGWQQRAEQAEAAVQRIHAFAASIQEPGAPLFWPEMGRRIQQELNDHGAGSGRCPSCDHPVSLHQPHGCRVTVTKGTAGRDPVCPCSAPRTTLDQPEEP